MHQLDVAVHHFLHQVGEFVFGFPTKFVESLSVGTPVIGNLTGDLASYLVDAETGVVCLDWSVQELEHGFEKALAMSDDGRATMRNECRKMARAEFDCGNFSEALGDFLKRVSE